MGRRIGIVAGSGPFVAPGVSDLRRIGFRTVVLGIEGETQPGVKKAADMFTMVRPGAVAEALAFFRGQDVSELLFLGKVRPEVIFRKDLLDAQARRLLEGIPERSATALLKAVFGYLEAGGLKVLNPGSFLKSHFCDPGVLTRKKPSPEALADVEFGLRIARRIADLEIGQALAVKRKAVVAVEGFEGTDRMIRRAGRLAGAGIVVVKAGRTAQDMKFDIPAVGLETVKGLVRAGGVVLGIEAAKVALFQREKTLALANSHGVSIVVRKID
ncbi:MAG: UDP-2,3-diacylglucosamine diphosphatase LpxI [Candidatus Aminicenantes bacterium]|nr:UDP-2,3-diacylglucosamine diphosphatase LpxI [Candidatus Aminicenantes bacterium]